LPAPFATALSYASAASPHLRSPFRYLTPRRHDSSPRSVNHSRGDEMEICGQNSKHAIGLMESVV
jgi:hypothetical protein